MDIFKIPIRPITNYKVGNPKMVGGSTIILQVL